MSQSTRRTHSADRPAKRKRPDQRSDPKPRYKIRRKIPAPSLHKPEGNSKLSDEQLAMPFVVPKRVEAQPFLKWVVQCATGGNDRATEFKQRCDGLKIKGVSLHSYRYAWAERALKCGFPERFAQQALGHNSKAVHRA